MIRILLADEYTIIRKGVRQILSQEYPSAEIEEVEEEGQWLQKMADSPWDLIISDLPMPDRGGLDTVRRIRETYPEIGILILTLYPRESYAVHALKAGASGFLGKDAAPEELIGTVKQLLAARQRMLPTIP